MRVAVAGGGIAGLSAAWELARTGHEVVVLEREPWLGGKIRTVRREGFVFEAGAESFLATKPHALELCAALGLERELVRARPGRAYVWGRGRLHPLPRGTRLVPTRLGPLLGSGLLSPREKARALFDLILPGAAPEGDESLASLVGRRMGGAVVDRIVAPLLAGIHAADPARLSVAATFPELLAIERGHGSVLRGLRVRGSAPGDASPFVSLTAGLDRLVARLGDALAGVGLRTGAALAGLEPTREGWLIASSDGGPVEAEGLVLALPSWAAAPLLVPHAPYAAGLLAGISWVSTAVVSLGYRESEAPPLPGHGFVVARDQRARITGSTWVSSKWPGRAPEGHVLVRAYLGRANDPIDLDAEDGTLAEVARADLARAMGLAAEPVLVDVARWPRSMAQLAVGHLDRLAAIERDVGRLRRVALAGAGYRGTGISDAVAQGLIAARAVVATEGVLQRRQRSGL